MKFTTDKDGSLIIESPDGQKLFISLHRPVMKNTGDNFEASIAKYGLGVEMENTDPDMTIDPIFRPDHESDDEKQKPEDNPGPLE